MTGQVFFAAFMAATTAVLASRVLVKPRRMLTGRLRPYASLSRSRLGTGYVDVSVSAITRHDDRTSVGRVFAPLVQLAAEKLGSVVDAADAETLSLRLRQAGFAETDPAQYRMRQLGYAVSGVAIGTFLGLLLFKGSPVMVLVMMVGLGFPGATLQRNRVESAIRERTEQMRSEVYTVTQLLAVRVRTGSGPVDAVRSVCQLARGPVVSELSEALGWISSGTSPQRAYDKLADVTPEPSAARLYRLLSASAQNGGDIASSLLAVAEDLREERRESMTREAVRRRTAMLLPLLMLIAPVMVLFVGAALMSFVLSGF